MVACLLALPAAAQPVILMSKGEPGAALSPGTGFIESPQSVSADGRFVVFSSDATNLVPNQSDTNAQFDVFLFDRVTKDRFLVSHVPGDETQAGDNESFSPRISADGDWVVFTSASGDLVPGPLDLNLAKDVFLYQRATGNVTLVSHQDGSGSSGNGASGALGEAQVAADGSFVAFTSDATNLVPGQVDTNGQVDVFVYDRQNDKSFLASHERTSLVTAAAGQSDSPALGSGLDGVFVAYRSTADDLVPLQVDDSTSGDIFLYGHDTQTNALVSGRFGSATDAAGRLGGTSRDPVVNAKGGFVYFLTFAPDLVTGVTDAGFDEDVYGYDRGPGTLTLVSHAAAAPLVAGNFESSDSSFSLSTDFLGGMLAYVSQATNLVGGQTEGNGGRDVFLWDRSTNTSTLVSHQVGSPARTANGESFGPALSEDGSFVAFMSEGTNLTSGVIDGNGTADAFLFEVAVDLNTLVSHRVGLPTTTVTSVGGPPFVAVSGNGDYVAHFSDAGDVVAGDLNGQVDVFLFSRAGGTNEAASLQAAAGTGGANGASQISNPPRNGISDDGRYSVFTSEASNLVPGQIDNNGPAERDVFLYDRQTGGVKMISHKQGSPEQSGNGGCQQPVISNDGNFVAFACAATDLVSPQFDTNAGMDVFVWNRATDTNQLVSFRIVSPTTTANGASERPSINEDGSLVAYQSLATNLVTTNALDDTNGASDVFLWRRAPNVNSLVSHVLFLLPADLLRTADNASFEPVLNARAGGQVFVAYTSLASNLLASVETGSPDPDVFVYADAPLTSALVSRNGGGQPANGASSAPSISDDGNWIAFHSQATDLGFIDPNGAGLDVVLHDRVAFVNRLVSHVPASDTTTAGTPGTASQNPQVSGDGTRVAFQSNAPNLVAETDSNSAPDVFLHDRTQAVVAVRNRLVSKAAGLAQTANGASTFPQVSTSGGRVAFQSAARNLAPMQADPNGGTLDVFVWDAAAGVSSVASRQRGTASTTGNRIADVPVLSGNGRFVAFRSLASNLVAADQNELDDAFLFELALADLRITKTSSGSAVPGAPFQYFLNVRNLGPEPVTGALVTDVLPPNLLSASWICVPTGGSCSASGVGDINDVVNLPVGAILDYTVSGTLALLPSSGVMSNTARVDPPLAITDPDPDNNELTKFDNLVPNAVLNLTHVDSPDPVVTLGIVSYVSTITNGGPSIADTVSLQVQVPPGAAFVSVSNPSCSFGGGFVTCGSLGNLLPGQNLTVTTTIQAPNSPGTIFSMATADSSSSAPFNATADTLVVDAAESLLEFFTVTSTDSTNTLEWRTPTTGYDHTKVLYRLTGICPAGPTDPLSTVLIGLPQPGPGAKGFAQHLGLPNDATVCYAAYVARDAAETAFSAARFAKGRPFVTTGPAKWAFSTGATAVVAPGLGGTGVYVPSNDRALYGIGRGLTGGTWLAGYAPLLFNAPVQSRPPVVPITIGAASLVTFVSSQDGNVFAIDANLGDLNPTDGVPSPIWPKGVATATQAAPAGWFQAFGGDADWAFIGTRMPAVDNVFYALLASSGTQVTPNGAFDNGGGATGIGIVSGGAAVDYANKQVYFTSRAKGGGSNKTAWCLALVTTASSEGFAPCWAEPLGDIDYGPVLRNNVVFVAPNTGEVIGLSAGFGTSLWSFGPVGLPKGFVVTDRTNDDLYVSAGGSVWGLTYQSSTARWTVGSIPNPSQPLFVRIGANSYVFVGSSDGRLYQIDATTGGGIKSVLLGDGLSQIGAPSFDGLNNLIYVGSDAGVIHSVLVPLP